MICFFIFSEVVCQRIFIHINKKNQTLIEVYEKKGKRENNEENKVNKSARRLCFEQKLKLKEILNFYFLYIDLRKKVKKNAKY